MVRYKQWVVKRTTVAAAAVFVIALCLYVATLQHTPGSFDVGDSQAAAATLGIAHISGFPIWTVLAYAWSHLPVAGSPAFMINLLTAIFGAVAAALLVLFTSQIGVRLIPATSAGLVFAFSTEPWARFTQAEVQALQVLLAMTLFLLWSRAEADPDDSRYPLAMLLVLGIGLAHHRLILVLSGPLLLLFFARRWRLLTKPAFLVKSFLFVTAPLLTYLYLPLRYSQGVSVVNEDMSPGWLIRGQTLAQNGNYLTPSSFGKLWSAMVLQRRTIFADRPFENIGGFGSLMAHGVGPVVAVLAVVGAFVMMRRAPRVLACFALTFTALVYVESNRGDPQARHFLIPIAFMVVAAAFGLNALMDVARRRGGRAAPSWAKWTSALALLVCVMLPVVLAAANYRKSDRRSEAKDQLVAQAVLESLPPRAVLWAYWDIRTTIQYLRYVEKDRPDVEIVDHRAYARYPGSDSAVAVGLATDPRLKGRPVYYAAESRARIDAVDPSWKPELIFRFDGPYAFDRINAGLYLMKPALRRPASPARSN